METNDALFNEVLAALSAKKPEKYFADLSTVSGLAGSLPQDAGQYKLVKEYLQEIVCGDEIHDQQRRRKRSRPCNVHGSERLCHGR